MGKKQLRWKCRMRIAGITRKNGSLGCIYEEDTKDPY